MPANRSYGDACAIARALDVVGERWALLVVRELLLGPQRYTELLAALANASSNLVADRLRELQAHGVVQRRRLPLPSNSWVYELTERGLKLESVIFALGDWGADAPAASGDMSLSATSALIFLQRSGPARVDTPPTTCRLDLDGQIWALVVAAGRLEVHRGDPGTSESRLSCDPKTLVALLDDPHELDVAVGDGRAVLSGDESALRRLLHALVRAKGGPVY